uniref:Uncharacterized protein n=1 Tax=Romanomermis culicivorax TaxID=13658 RepID=A0A915KFT5_ROMCU
MHYLRPCHTSPRGTARYRAASGSAGCPIHTNRRRRGVVPRGGLSYFAAQYRAALYSATFLLLDFAFLKKYLEPDGAPQKLQKPIYTSKAVPCGTGQHHPAPAGTAQRRLVKLLHRDH